MTYKLEFKKQALKEWKKLSPDIQAQFKSKLAERLIDSHVASAKINGGNRNSTGRWQAR